MTHFHNNALPPNPNDGIDYSQRDLREIVLAGGCFWGVQAYLRRVPGVAATTVGYANEGTTLYFLCGLESQKAANLARDDRVSLTIDDDTPEVMEITGLSMAAHATPIVDTAEADKVMQLLWRRYPPQNAVLPPMPAADEVRLFRVEPTVISVLDYSKGFGHTELVAC